MRLRMFLVIFGCCFVTAKAVDEIIDCSNEDSVNSVFIEPIDLNFSGVLHVYENITINKLLNTSNNEFDKNYIDARMEFNETTDTENLVIFTTEHFSRYAVEQTAVRLTLRIVMSCPMGRERNLIIFQPLLEGNYFRPKFSQDVYEILMPTPIFAGFDLTMFQQITARDDDLTNNRIVFSSPDAAEHFVALSTRNSTSDDPKTFFANLTLERIYLELATPFTFNITATDTGEPPLQSTATVVVRADPNHSLSPKPQFGESVYTVALTANLTLEAPLELEVVRETFSPEVEFSILGTDADLFRIQNQSNVLRLSLVESPLNWTIVANKRYLQCEVRAQQPILVEYGRTAIIVEVPKLQDLFHFEKTHYEGSLGENGTLDIASIVLQPNASPPLNVSLELTGFGADSFIVSKINNQIDVHVGDPFAFANFSDHNPLLLELVATTGALQASTLIQITLPSLSSNGSSPVFEKSVYSGSIGEDMSLRIERMSLLNESFVANVTQFELIAGNQLEIFELNPIAFGVELTLRRTLIAEELPSGSIAMVLMATNRNLKGFTSVIIQLPTQSSSAMDSVFQTKWQLGQLLEDDSGSQNLKLSQILLKPNVGNISNYNFSLIGEEANYFSLVTDAANGTAIEVNLGSQPLPTIVLETKAQISLELRAIAGGANVSTTDSTLILIQLPRPDCQRPSTAPLFDSPSYSFAIRPNQLGVFGRVEAKVSGLNAPLQYSLIIENDYLQSRIAITQNTSELTVLNYLAPGTYTFSVHVKNVETFANSSVLIRLDVDTLFECADHSVSVSHALLVKHINEEQPYENLLNGTLNDCQFEIIDMHPNDLEYVFLNKSSGMFSVIAVDRESEVFANMSIPQIELRLHLNCNAGNQTIGQNVSALRDDESNATSASSFAADIRFTQYYTVLRLIIDDVNDHPPEFSYNSVPVHLAYPSSDICFELFPEYLTKVHAVDRDSGLNADVRYSITPNEHFDIDTRTGEIFPKVDALHSEDSVELMVLATDRAGASDGLKAALMLYVHRLSGLYFSLLTVEGTQRNNFESVLSELENRTGYSIFPIKSATIPRAEISLQTKARLSPMDTVQQQVWTYAFSRSEPVKCVELQEKLRELGGGDAAVVVESYANVGLTSNVGMPRPGDLEDGMAVERTIYITFLVLLLVISCVCMGILVWRKNLTLNCCRREKSSDDLNACDLSQFPPPTSDGNVFTRDCERVGHGSFVTKVTVPRCVYDGVTVNGSSRFNDDGNDDDWPRLPNDNQLDSHCFSNRETNPPNGAPLRSALKR